MASFFQDPAAVNSATWAGLVLTILGFGVSIQQIMKVKTAARAAEQATKGAFALIKERIDLTEVTVAISHVEAITQAVSAKDYAGALTTMRGLRAKLIALRQVPFDDPDERTLGSHLATLSLLADELASAWHEGSDLRLIPFLRDLERLSDTLNDYAVRMRYMERGPRSEVG